ncbi:hypothetical protein HP550_17495 [Cellulomonas humilata]|uniref:Uncharacterized protein n=1 Tax=Cellulomonas humilata TaxID=144055 RepID=A0A7Y6A3F3_9CELL|nr:hypothetical protein [Cellulomonas humilata]NUU19046.1 hypothetical protein [Cellulomonas humilata]
MTLSSSALWAEWKRITRFLNSTQIALARERLLWESLELDRAADTRLHVPADKGEYVVRLDEHLESLSTLSTLHAAVLIQSYAVAEAAACDRLRLDQRTAGGIEEWGQALLAANGRGWADVHGGRGGAVEVAVARNAYAHAAHLVDAKAEARLAKAGSVRWTAGSLVDLQLADVVEFRTRIRSLLRYGGFHQPPSPPPTTQP